MEYRKLGSSGLRLSALSLGAWVTFGGQVDEDTAYDCMTAAYECGVNFFDNAEAYAKGQAEFVMGKIIKKAGWKRSDLVISTKIFWGGSGPNQTGLSRKHIIEGTLASLGRLQMDYVDLIFCHRPDIYTPIEETVRAMDYLVNQGRAFYWGTSQWSARQIVEAYGIARREHLVPPQMEQPEYNMFSRQLVELEYTHLYTEIGLGTTIWSPLANGLLTGKYQQGIPDGSRLSLKEYDWLRKDYESAEGQAKIKKVESLQNVAEELSCSLAQLGLAWCLKNPNVSTVITGASKRKQLLENMKAPEIAEKIDADLMARIDSILQNKPEPESDNR